MQRVRGRAAEAPICAICINLNDRTTSYTPGQFQTALFDSTGKTMLWGVQSGREGRQQL